MQFVGFGKEPAGGDVQTPDLVVVRRDAQHINVFEEIVSGAHIARGVLAGGDLVGSAHRFFQRGVLFHRDQGAFLRLHPRVKACDNAKAIHDEDICAEIGDAIGNVKVEAGDDAHHRHQRSDCQDYPEKGQETAQFMGAQSVQGEAERLFLGHPGAPKRHYGSAPATAGCRRGW